MIHISEKYLIRRELLVYVWAMSDKLYIKEKENIEVKKACLYLRQIKTVKEVTALKDITSQNLEPAPRKS